MEINPKISEQFSALGLNGSAGKRTDGNTSRIENPFLHFKKKVYMDPKIRENAVKLINEEFLPRLLFIKYDEKTKEITYLRGLGPNGLAVKDDKEQDRIVNDFLKLQNSLISFAESSDEAAYFITKAYSNRNFTFLLADKETMEKMKLDKYTAVYFHELKSIIMPLETLENNDIKPLKFNEILCHEFTHAIDDIAVIDTDPKHPNALSKDALKEKIKLMLSEELEKNKKLMAELKTLRIDKLTKKLKEDKPSITKEEIDKEILASFDERPIHRIGKDNTDEMELVKKNTWLWEEIIDGTVVVQLITYLEENEKDKENFDINKRTGSNRLVMEYAAFGVEFYLSGDRAKKERLEKQDPKFYEFLKNEFIPHITA